MVTSCHREEMSKLLEKLEQVAEGKPLGFGAAATRPKTPSLVVIARLPKADASLAGTVAEEGADALLLPLKDLGQEKEALSETVKKAGEMPWGIHLEAPTPGEMAGLSEMGCDFVVFGQERTAAAALKEGGMGRVLEIDPSLPDGLARALNLLPIDALLVAASGEVTVHRLLLYQRLTALVHKPLLAAATEGDIESLWEVGVKGVVVSMGGARPKEKLSRIQRAVKDLPTTRKKPREGMDVILPLAGEMGESFEEEGEI